MVSYSYTDYIFYIEHDWRFLESEYLSRSRDILQRYREIGIVDISWRTLEEQGIESYDRELIDNRFYWKKPWRVSDAHLYWYGWVGSPNLKRRDDLVLLGRIEKWYNEWNIDRKFLALGLKSVFLNGKYVDHLGDAYSRMASRRPPDGTTPEDYYPPELQANRRFPKMDWMFLDPPGARPAGQTDPQFFDLNRASALEPDNPRSWFELAQTERAAGRFAVAAKAYAKRAAMGGDADEVWYARLLRARCLRDLGDEGGFLGESLTLSNERPDRAEPLYDLARFHRERRAHETAMLFAEKGIGLDLAEGNPILIENFIYEWGLQEEISIAGFYCRDPARKRRGAAACNQLAFNPKAPDYVRDQAGRNLGFYRALTADQAPACAMTPVDTVRVDEVGGVLSHLHPAGSLPEITGRRDGSLSRCCEFWQPNKTLTGCLGRTGAPVLDPDNLRRHHRVGF